MGPQGSPRSSEPSGWAIAGVTVAAVMLITIGTWHAIDAIAAIPRTSSSSPRRPPRV